LALVEREEVAKVVKALMEGDEGKRMQECMKKKIHPRLAMKPILCSVLRLQNL